MEECYYIGVDVGTQSARAGLFTSNGKLVAMHKQNIEINKPKPEQYEQSSEDIWQQICSCVRYVVSQASATEPMFSKEKVRGIGMDATCSLVAVDRTNGEPVSVSMAGSRKWNIIMWCDHRASAEAEMINKSKVDALKYVGGKISIEMELPKIAWLKRFLINNNRVSDWNRVEFFDLPDFLTYKATNVKARSNCSLACKWLFMPLHPDERQSDGKCSREGWIREAFEAAGMGDVADNGYSRVGGSLEDGTLTVLQAGDAVGTGLSETAAADLGLIVGTPVGASVVDAYAGWFGTVGSGPHKVPRNMVSMDLASQRLAIIAGTSACYLLSTKQPVFVPGVWGPYYSVGLSGFYMLEGGQSAVGSLLDYVVQSHAAYPQLCALSKENNTSVFTVLDDMLIDMVKANSSNDLLHIGASPTSLTAQLVRSLHFLPDHHGNRAPLADPNMRGAIVGETLTSPDGLESLALQYLACLCGLSYGTRAILDAIVTSGGQPVKELLISGGLSQGKLFTQILADVNRAHVIIPKAADAGVVLGSAILGQSAAISSSRSAKESYEEHAHSLWHSILQMSGDGITVSPTDNKYILDLHDRKYLVMLEMQKDQIKYRSMMNE